MSKLKNEIKACMSGLRKTENQGLSAEFSFPDEFIGFQGHFPNKPILPGVCKIQAALLMFEEAKQKSVRLKEITNAKFFSPVTSNQEIVINLEESQDKDSDIVLRVKVSSADKKIAELSLKVYFPE